MNGRSGSPGVKRGRPKKKPGYDRDKEINDLIDQAIKLFEIPYDDRKERPPDAPSIHAVAEQMHTSRVRLKKLLITAGYYSTETSRWVQELLGKGYTINQIMKKTGLSNAGVNAVIPYDKGAYKLKEPHPYAENCRVFRKRKKCREQLIEHLDTPEDLMYLWNAIEVFENYGFQMEDGRKFKYRMDGDSIRLDEKMLSRDEVEGAFCKIRNTRREAEGADKTAIWSCEELHAIFLRIGAYE